MQQLIRSLGIPLILQLFSLSPAVDGYNYYDDSLAPVILIHGVGGSQLKAKWETQGQPEYCDEKQEEFDYIWLSMSIAVKGDNNLRCWVYRFKILYDQKNQRFTNQNGVVTIVRGNFGSLESSEYVAHNAIAKFKTEYYHHVIENFEDADYSEELSMKAASYDWRFPPQSLAEQLYYDQLTQLVEEMAQKTSRKVTIIAHSMGGLVTAHFLLMKPQAWKDKYINSFVSIGTPWLGSTATPKSYVVGNNWGISWLNVVIMKVLLRSLPSVALLMPYEEEFKDEVLMEWTVKNKTYTSKDYRQFYTDIGFPEGFEIRQRVRGIFPVPLDKLGVQYHCIWSRTTKPETPGRFRVTDPNLPEATEISGEQMVEGDGTVNIKSLRYCERFKNATVKSFDGPNHTGLLYEKVLSDYLLSSVLKNGKSL
ncbi:unnamed protein product [Bemisia tabaci]|uniref:Uncharacterized protein n=1 Tax=Bemisia tabaci TaxID=7038 RepID=A0A9P0AB16_BEMTA|nr:unnamed protein product [Bemisia tabaci]